MQGPLQGTDGQQAGIGDDAAAVEGDVELLRTEVPKGKVTILLLRHDLEPPHEPKLLNTHNLDSARGSFLKKAVRNPG